MENIFASLSAVTDVDHGSDIDMSTFVSDYNNRNIPVKLEQAFGGWPALNLWDPAFFSEKFGEREIVVGNRPTTIADFVRALDRPPVSAADNPYVRQIKLKQVFPELLEHVQPVPPFLLPNWLDAAHLPARFGPLWERRLAATGLN